MEYFELHSRSLSFKMKCIDLQDCIQKLPFLVNAITILVDCWLHRRLISPFNNLSSHGISDNKTHQMHTTDLLSNNNSISVHLYDQWYTVIGSDANPRKDKSAYNGSAETNYTRSSLNQIRTELGVIANREGHKSHLNRRNCPDDGHGADTQGKLRVECKRINVGEDAICGADEGLNLVLIKQ